MRGPVLKSGFLWLFIFLLQSANSQTNTVGVLQISAAKENGFTLLAPGLRQEVFLLDDCGREVNRWENSQYFPGAAVYLLEDGSLLKTCRVSHPVFAMGGLGGRLERWSWEDSLLWAYDYSTSNHTQHHDIEPLPNGNILILATRTKSGFEVSNSGRQANLIFNGKVWVDYLVEIEPVGTDSARVVWEWDAWDHLIQDADSGKANFGMIQDHPEKINVNFAPHNISADWLHCNSVSYHPQLDQIMLSVAHWGEIWVIDHSTTSQEAAGSSGGNYGKGGDLLYRWGNPQAYGRGVGSDQVLDYQHDAKWILHPGPDSGKVVVFNNGVGRGYYSVEVIEPPEVAPGEYQISTGQAFGPSGASRSYLDTSRTPHQARNRSGVEPLPNGNLLICLAPSGYVREVTPGNQIAWEYINPVGPGSIASQGDPAPQGDNSMFRLPWYAMDFPGFTGKDLTPGNTLESGTDFSFCDSLINGIESEERKLLILYPNPSNGEFFANAKPGSAFIIRDQMGREIFHGQIPLNQKIKLSHFLKGIFWISISGFQTQKIVVNP